MNRQILMTLAVTLLTGMALGHPAPANRVSVPGGSYFTIEPRELETILKTKDFPLVNVHIPYEGEIAGTDSFIAFDQIGVGQIGVGQMASRKLLPKDKKAELVIYCRSGRMSTIAAQALVKLGYSIAVESISAFLTWLCPSQIEQPLETPQDPSRSLFHHGRGKSIPASPVCSASETPRIQAARVTP